MAQTSIKGIIQERAREKGWSLRKLARMLGRDYDYLRQVLHGRSTSRPVIKELAQILGLPNLPDLYEEFLTQKRVEKKKGVSTKGGGER